MAIYALKAIPNHLKTCVNKEKGKQKAKKVLKDDADKYSHDIRVRGK